MSLAAEKLVDDIMQGAIELAERKVSLSEMVNIVSLEAHRIEGSERARLLAGFIDEPNWEQVERIALLLAVMKFLEQCRDQPGKIADWLRRRDV